MEEIMALKIDGRMKVKTLKSEFKKEFGLTLRIYSGVNFADDDATLASIRKGESKGGEFSPQRNTKVGNFEDKMMDMFGIKTQVAGSDDSYLCDNNKTLAGALEADEKLMNKRAKRVQNTSNEKTDSKQNDTNNNEVNSTNAVGVLCLDWNDEEIIEVTAEPPKLFVFGFFVDESEEDEEEPYYSLKAYVATGDNGSGSYSGWIVHGEYFADEVDVMEDGSFPDEALEEQFPEEMKKLRELISKYSAYPEAVGGGFPDNSMLNEADIDELYEQPYLINTIAEEDRLVSQYADKVGDIDLDEMPEDIFNVVFTFYEDE